MGGREGGRVKGVESIVRLVGRSVDVGELEGPRAHSGMDGLRVQTAGSVPASEPRWGHFWLGKP